MSKAFYFPTATWFVLRILVSVLDLDNAAFPLPGGCPLLGATSSADCCISLYDVKSVRLDDQAHRMRLMIKPELGGACRDRTDDPLLAKQMLSQLSYAPVLSGITRFRLVRRDAPMAAA